MARAGEKVAFCASLDWDIPIEWFDLTGMHQLDNGHVARIELSDNPGQGCGMVGTYRSFDVTIVDPGSGAVASKVFPFDDYLDADERSDTRMAYDDGFRVVSHVGWKWYIAIPTTTRALCAAIERWIALFRGESASSAGAPPTPMRSTRTASARTASRSATRTRRTEP